MVSFNHHTFNMEVHLSGNAEEMAKMIPAAQSVVLAALGAAMQELKTVTEPLLAAQAFLTLKDSPDLQVTVQTNNASLQAIRPPKPEVMALPNPRGERNGRLPSSS